MIRGTKNAAGTLLGAWSEAVKVTGETGIGIDNLPRDPYAYWSCDDLPDIPDNPAGTMYRNDPAWTGWTSSSNFPEGTVSVANGILTMSGRKYTMGNKPIASGKIFIIRARTIDTGDVLQSDIITPTNQYGLIIWGDLTTEWKIFTAIVPEGGYVTLRNVYRKYYSTYEATVQISDIYIGDGSFLTPLIDNSGNDRHAINVNGQVAVIIKEGRKAVTFLGSGYFNAGNILLGHTGDFAVSLHTDRTVSILGSRGGSYSMGFGYHFGLAYFISDNPNAEVYAGTPFIEDGKLHHVVVQIKNKVLYLYNDGALSGTGVNISDIYNSPIGYYPFIIGGINQHEIYATGATVCDIAVFSRALTDTEIYALYKAPLEKKFSGKSAQPEEKYLGVILEPDLASGGVVAIEGGSTVKAGLDNFVA
jgi:hypothetical protein